MARKKSKAVTPTQVYQIKVTLRDTKPPVWRRVLVPAELTLEGLHYVLQDVMGWTNSHLHQFVVGNRSRRDEVEYYGVPGPDDWVEVTDEAEVTVGELVARLKGVKKKFLYEYDFGDSWEHELIVEKALPPEPGVRYPVCLAGKRACPPEDCGGVWGYADFVEAMGDPRHPRHGELKEWYAGEFDPEAFRVDAVNRLLKRYG
jgi:hypothetical protein